MTPLFLILVLSVLPALASDDERKTSSFLALPEETYLRGEAVLAHFEASEAPRPPLEIGEFASSEAIARRLKFLSRDANRFFNENWTFYRDADSKRHVDFEVRARPSAKLSGFRIAIDPGHMGGEFWDAKTGKYVDGPEGRLSEGLLTLQTALLLEEKLKADGAQVLLTRRGLGPAAERTPEAMDLSARARLALRDASLAPWFLSLLELAPPGPALFEAFAASPEFQLIHSERMRYRYFIRGEDMDARVRKIQDFAPHLTIVLHFDAATSRISPVPVSATKAYVPGDVGFAELATSERRAEFARHLLGAAHWENSLALSRALTAQLSLRLQIPFDGWGGGAPVEPGVYARNLVLTRSLHGHAASYVEVLRYDDPEEYRRLTDAHYPLLIGGKNFPYSERLREAAAALYEGIQEFRHSSEITL